MCVGTSSSTLSDGTYFARGAFRSIQGGALLGFAEVRVVRVTTPQLFTWVKCAKLKQVKEENQVLI